MFIERLKRVFLVVIVALVAVGLVKVLVGMMGETKISSGTANLAEMPVKEKLEEVGGEILGKAVSLLPGVPGETETKEETQATEPIEEPAQNVQNQTQILIEAIKKLPEDQLEAIKKQLYQEICEGVLKE
ncbi:MAG: hypothetical protein MUP45_02380 [Candidatus Marinimicrobia bacterium]|nr:hypothetical protein [Candidatus Neomarinimicrobiota bacterium]